MQKDAVKKANTATIKKAINKKMFNQDELFKVCRNTKSERINNILLAIADHAKYPALEYPKAGSCPLEIPENRPITKNELKFAEFIYNSENSAWSDITDAASEFADAHNLKYDNSTYIEVINKMQKAGI